MSVFLLFLWLHEWMRTQMLAKPSSNLQRIGGEHRGSHAQPGWRTFMMTCLRWIFGYMRLRDLPQNRPLWRLMFLHSNFTLVVVHATNGLDCRSVGVYSWWLVHERRGIDTLQCHHWSTYSRLPVLEEELWWLWSASSCLADWSVWSLAGTGITVCPGTLDVWSLASLSNWLFYTHTHARLTALCPGLPRWAGARKVKPIWILLKQETKSSEIYHFLVHAIYSSW